MSKKSSNKAASERLKWISVFDQMIPQYQETRASNGTLGALNYEQASNKGGGGNKNPFYVAPNTGDFVADVEIQARRALTLRGNGTLYFLFMAVYAFEITDPEKIGPDILEEIKWRVGKELKSAMYPVSRYLRGKVVSRASQRPESCA